MKIKIIVICLAIFSAFLFSQENIVIEHGNIITDTKNIFTIQPVTSYATAIDIQSGISKRLDVPQLEGMSNLVAKYANTTPDGYVLSAIYTKADASKKGGHYTGGIFFLDKEGNYKSVIEFTDREFYAVAPWDADAIVIAWGRQAFRAGETFNVMGLTVTDRKGHVVAELGEQRRYEVEEFRTSIKSTWQYHRLYWQGDQLIYVDPTASEITFFGKDASVKKNIKARIDGVPSTGIKGLQGFFKAGGKTIHSLYGSGEDRRKLPYWAYADQPDIIHPQSGQFKAIHVIGDKYYVFMPINSGVGNLVQITDDNWQSLFQ